MDKAEMRRTFLAKKALELGIAVFVMGVILMIGVFTFAGPCEGMDGTESACATAGTAIRVGSALLSLCAAMTFYTKKPVLRTVFLGLCVVLGGFVVLAPGVIFPLCMMETMRCQMVMRPFAQVVGGMAGGVALIGLVISIGSQKK